MLAKRITRSSGKRRAYLSLGLLGGMMAIVALALGHFSATRAQSVGQCAPTGSPNVVNCVFTTTTALAPGGTLELQLTNPSTATFQGVVGSLPPGCAAVGGLNTAIFTIGCAVASLGMQSGVTFTLGVAGVPSTTAFVTATVTYNANGAAPQVPLSASTPGDCSGTPILPTSLPTLFTCTNTPLTQTVSGGTLTLQVSAPSGSATSLQITNVSGGLGSCFILGTTAPPQPPTPGASGTVGVTCASGESTTPCPFFTGLATPPCPGTLGPNPAALITITGTATNTGLASATLSEVTVSNANGPAGPPVSIVAPPEVLAIGACGALTAGVGSVATCTNVPGLAAQAGQELVMSITAAVGQTIFVSAAPAAAGTCQLATPLPSGITGPEGTVVVSYTCDVGQTGGVTTAGVCLALAGLGSTAACTNTPGAATFAGGALSLTVSAVSGQTIDISAAPALAGTCPLDTALPTPSGSSATVTYSCGPSQSTGAPVPITVTATNTSATAGTPTESTAAGAPVAPVVTVTNANGVAGTPSEVTMVNTQGPGQPGCSPSPGCSPTPGIPAPTTSNLTFSVCGVAVTCALTATPTAATGTPGTSTPVPSTPTPTGTATTTLGGGGSCSAPVGTATPTAGCITTGTTCVPAARATLPTAPASGPPTVNPNGPYQGYTGEPLQFLGAARPATSPLGTTIISCIWTFGDGAFSHYIGATHTYLSAGPFTANLTVTDSQGNVTSLNVPVLIAPLGQLCQQPGAPLGSGLSPACSAAPGCLAASFNNGCQPTCPANGETLLPNQCPGPATNNQIWVNGPFNVGIDQPLTVTVDTNVAPGSTLLPGDVVKFDWGDGQVIYNTPQPGVVPAILFGGTGGATATSSSTTVPLTVCADQVIVGVVGPTACLNDGGPAPLQFQQASSAGVNPAFPAPMTSAHGYTQPGTYNLRVTMIFSDGTGATAQTTVTVTGSPASLATAGSFPPPQSAPATAMPLNAGCNSIELTFPNGTAVTTVAGAVTGTTVVSIGETPPNAPPLTWYTTAGVGTNNLVSVQHGDWATICVTGSGVLNQPSS